MANIAFKRGLAANLPARNAATDGTFYLTTDTHKLYVGQGSELVDLNQYIRTWEGNSVPTLSDVPYVEVGDIYYWPSQNVLMVADEVTNSAVSWTQLNPDSHLVNSSGNLTVAAVTSGVSITDRVADSGNYVSSGTVSIIGGDNVTITNSGNTITITSQNDTSDTHYTMGTSTNAGAGVITLTSDLNSTTASAGTVTMTGSGTVQVASDSSGAVTITGALPTPSLSQSWNESGTLTSRITINGATAASTATITPTIHYGDTTTAAVFASGIATLDVYTKTETDSKITSALKQFDAMMYKGTVSSDDASTKLVSTAQAGDTYKASTKITSPVAANAGDLIIASGSDGAVTWEVVSAGDDQTITGSVSATSIRIADNAGTLAQMTLQEDANQSILVSGSASGKSTVVTISHNTPTSGSAAFSSSYASSATQTAGTKSSASTFAIPVISGLTKDSLGHIVDIQTGVYTVIDSHNGISSITQGVASSSNIATVSTVIRDSDGSASVSGSFSLATDNDDNIKFSASGTQVKINFEWGSF